MQDELPTWSDDDDGALESVSEPASGPEMSDDESISSEHEVSVLAAAEEVDEFGRIGSRPASPGQTIGPMKTPAKASARKSQPEEVVVIPAEPQGDQRPEVDRTVTARPGGLKSNAGSRDVSLGAASEATRADGSEVSSAASADTPIPHRTETDHAAAVSPTPTRSVAEHTAATTPFPPLEPADHVSAISPLPRKTDITSPSHKPRTYSSSSRSLHSRSSSLDNINTEMPLDPRPEVERAVLSRSRSGHSDRGHSRTSSLDHRSELGHAPAAQADEEDDIEMLRPESTDLSNLVESLEPVGGSPRLGGGGFVEALSPQSSPKVVREDDKMPSAGVVIDTGSKDLGLKHHRSHSSTE